jgi:S-adenosylmethionine:tRNA ribosyltransferase-isomerase
MVVERSTGRVSHDVFRNIANYLPPRSLIVINNSKVISARLLGKKARTGGSVEVFLLKQIDARHFEAMLRPLKKIREGEELEFPGGIACVLADRGQRIVRFKEKDILKKLGKAGHIPLPPYIRRPDEALDREYYQTVYARKPGSVAAPTAGLHFTRPLIASLKRAGHEFLQVTLHVNYGTFKPVEAENILDHPMHEEHYAISPAVLAKIKAVKKTGQKIVAVGTTSCRTLEAFARTGKTVDTTKLFLYPGCDFKLTDVLITNFHLPKSTLLMLVAAFGGLSLIRKAYEEAIATRYRFYSYGDAMIII